MIYINILFLNLNIQKKGLIDTGYAEIIFHALECLSHQRESKYVILVYVCLTSLLATIEHWDNTLNVFEVSLVHV